MYNALLMKKLLISLKSKAKSGDIILTVNAQEIVSYYLGDKILGK